MNKTDFIATRFSNSNESWEKIIDRVSKNGSSKYIDSDEIKHLLKNGYLIPSGQILRKMGFNDSLLFSCYVTEANETESSIDIAKRITDWTLKGTGVGVNPSSWIRSSNQTQVEAVNKIFDDIGLSQEEIWKAGTTRTATMINLDFDLDGIIEVSSKLHLEKHLKHINIGIVIGDSEMNEMIESYQLKCPNPKLEKLRKIASVNWETGNPGLIFIDRVNIDNIFNSKINSCNPCAEQYLEPNEGCNLASINLEKFIIGKSFNFSLFKKVVEKGILFLDNVIDVSEYPNFEAKVLSIKRRRIGLGIIGFGKMLEMLSIYYGSADSLDLINKIGITFNETAQKTSIELAKKEGSFPDFLNSKLVEMRRNAYLFSIAPTGSISLIWNTSSGIEPIFASMIAKGEFKFKFRDRKKNKSNATDISYRDQVNVLSNWQSHIDGGISKTINLANSATVEDILEIYFYAWNNKCKSISVYRDKCRENAFLTLKK